jgi:hypothetical protein
MISYSDHIRHHMAQLNRRCAGSGVRWHPEPSSVLNNTLTAASVSRFAAEVWPVNAHPRTRTALVPALRR